MISANLRPSILVLFLTLLLAFGPAEGQPGQPLSLNDRPVKSRVSPELLALARETTRSPFVAADRPSHIIFDGPHVGVRITAANVDRLLPHLESLGFSVLGSAPDHFLIEGTLPVASVPALESLTDVGFLGAIPLYRPVTGGGSVTSQADVVHETDRVRGTLPTGYDGSGMTIGILSDSYNSSGGAANGVASGDLPAVITIIEDASGSDEGRAMVELAYDLAPGADFAFATALGGEANFANNIRNLAGSGSGPTQAAVDVMVDDVAYFTEPFFQDSLVGQAIDDVVTNDGVAYFTSAGNYGTEAYESTAFVPTFDAGTGLTFHDFNPTGIVDIAQRITIGSGASIQLVLQWDDPFYRTGGVDTDLDIYLFNSSGSQVAASTLPNSLIQLPLEILNFTNSGPTAGFDIAIALDAGPPPGRIKYINFGQPFTVTEYDTDSPTVVSHAAAAGGQAVAAAFYGNQLEPESFTSLGPSTILFAPDGTPLGTPDIRSTPNITAIDGTNTTFFGSDIEGDGFPNFFGTSAAAPHAAAVAALVRQANPTFTPAQVYDRLAATATDITTPGSGFDNVTGSGLINAYDAIFDVQPAVPSASFADPFEAAVLSAVWETRSTGPGRIRLTDAHGPDEGAQHVALDRHAISSLESPINFALNELILHLDLTAADPVTLSFAVREVYDEDHPMPAAFSGSHNSDGVALSVDGINWFRLLSLTGSAVNTVYQSYDFNLSQAAADNSLTLGSDVQIKFQQYDNFPIDNAPTPGNSDGLLFDDIQVITGRPEIELSSADQPLLIGAAEQWGHVDVNQPLTRTFTITNSGVSQSLNLAGLTTTLPFSVGSDFGSTSLAPGASTTFAIVFSPTDVGPASQTVTFTTNDSDENPFAFTATGSGGRPLYLPVIARP